MRAHEWHPIEVYYQEGRVPEHHAGHWFCAKCLLVTEHPDLADEYECVDD